MSDIVQQLFYMAMEKLPYIPNPEMDKIEEELNHCLDQEGKRLLRDYENAWLDKSREDARRIFYIALALGVELGTLHVN